MLFSVIYMQVQKEHVRTVGLEKMSQELKARGFGEEIEKED